MSSGVCSSQPHSKRADPILAVVSLASAQTEDSGSCPPVQGVEYAFL